MNGKFSEVLIKIVPHQEYQYSTLVRRFEAEGGRWVIEVCELGDARYEFLVIVHELVEWFLSRLKGVERRGVEANGGDSGMKVNYYWEHVFATLVERMVALQLDVDWKEYCEKLKREYER